MSHSTSIRDRLRARGIIPRKSLGQNFLTDDDSARRIVRLANVKAGDVVIEIGPGIGALTRHLAQAARQVIAIEIDRNLIPILQDELQDVPNVTIVQGDALDVDYMSLLREACPDGLLPPLRVVGNLPYYITSALIRLILELPIKAEAIVFTVQLEVADRMVAAPGDMSLLSVSVQFYGKAEMLLQLSPSAFYPQPDVDSAVVRITPRAHTVDGATLFSLARAGFSQRRKQLRNTLAAGLRLPKDAVDQLLLRAGVDPTRRAETLSIPEWIHLSAVFDVAGLGKDSGPANAGSDADNSSEVQAPSTANTTEP
jgi:16S rRNA (adenine1518-N6/adenine1519-N6)-dimethyltransferase